VLDGVGLLVGVLLLGGALGLDPLAVVLHLAFDLLLVPAQGLGHEFGRAVQSLFGFDHRLGRRQVARISVALRPLPAIGAEVEELYTYPAQDPITEITSETDHARRGQLPLFFGPDTHEGDLYASADETTFYRLTPATDSLFERIGDVEDAVGDLSTTSLQDWSDGPASNGDVAVWNESTGQWEPSAVANPTTLGDLTDVTTAGSTTGQGLVRQSSGTWAGGAPNTTWNNVSGKPSTFPPSTHNHDGRYYTKEEVDGLVGEHACRDDRQGRVLVAHRSDTATDSAGV
jgi:hypothetical protein